MLKHFVTSSMLIGFPSYADFYLAGKIQDIKIFNLAQSPFEVLSSYLDRSDVDEQDKVISSLESNKAPAYCNHNCCFGPFEHHPLTFTNIKDTHKISTFI